MLACLKSLYKNNNKGKCIKCGKYKSPIRTSGEYICDVCITPIITFNSYQTYIKNEFS